MYVCCISQYHPEPLQRPRDLHSPTDRSAPRTHTLKLQVTLSPFLSVSVSVCLSLFLSLFLFFLSFFLSFSLSLFLSLSLSLNWSVFSSLFQLLALLNQAPPTTRLIWTHPLSKCLPTKPQAPPLCFQLTVSSVPWSQDHSHFQEYLITGHWYEL